MLLIRITEWCLSTPEITLPVVHFWSYRVLCQRLIFWVTEWLRYHTRSSALSGIRKWSYRVLCSDSYRVLCNSNTESILSPENCCKHSPHPELTWCQLQTTKCHCRPLQKQKSHLWHFEISLCATEMTHTGSYSPPILRCAHPSAHVIHLG